MPLTATAPQMKFLHNHLVSTPGSRSLPPLTALQIDPMLDHLVATISNRFQPPLTVPQIDPMLKLREQINGSAAAGTKISVNDFVIKAASLALKKVRGGREGGGGQGHGSSAEDPGLCLVCVWRGRRGFRAYLGNGASRRRLWRGDGGGQGHGCTEGPWGWLDGKLSCTHGVGVWKEWKGIVWCWEPSRRPWHSGWCGIGKSRDGWGQPALCAVSMCGGTMM